MLCEISSETLLQGVTPQAPSVMSNRPGQASPVPTGEELAKPMDSLQVTSSATKSKNNNDDKDGDINDDSDDSNDSDH